MSTKAFSIFVADDNSVLLQGIERALSSYGYLVRTASSGTAMLELLEGATEPPDLLLLDVMMPGVSGLEILRKVNGDPRWRDLPVMLITASTDDLLPVTALRSGAVDFLPKPFRLGELIARIEAHIQRSRELARARAESRSRLHARELVRELNGMDSAGEMLRLVAGRLAGICTGSRCGIMLVNGAARAQMIVSSDARDGDGRDLALNEYPELRAALDAGAPLLIEDTETSPLFAELRTEWEQNGLPFPVTSTVVIPLGSGEHARGALLLRSPRGYPPLNEEALTTALQVTHGLIHALGQTRIFELLMEQPHHPDPPPSPPEEPAG